ncbi:MAG: hypothetical protein QM771_06080 [Nitrospira sp.]
MATLVAGFALVGLPPFSPFVSELLVVSALSAREFCSDSMHVGRFVAVTVSDEMRSLGVVGVFLFFGVVLFGGMMARIGAMVWGLRGQGHRGESWTVGHVPVLAMIVALIGLSFMLPESLRTLVTRAVHVDCGEVTLCRTD